jgi:hypothetical protein
MAIRILPFVFVWNNYEKWFHTVQHMPSVLHQLLEQRVSHSRGVYYHETSSTRTMAPMKYTLYPGVHTQFAISPAKPWLVFKASSLRPRSAPQTPPDTQRILSRPPPALSSPPSPTPIREVSPASRSLVLPRIRGSRALS